MNLLQARLRHIEDGGITIAEEKSFENEVKKWLESIGIYPAGTPVNKMSTLHGWYFKVWGGGFQKSGIPDLVGNINGHFIAIELKAQRGRPSDLQIHNVKHIRDSLGCACFLYPSGFNDFKEDILLLRDNIIYQIKEVYK